MATQNSSKAGQPKRPPGVCRFFLAGKCNRDPCRFSHSPKTATFSDRKSKPARSTRAKPASKPHRPMLEPPRDVCKFSWNRRRCPHGDACRFKHYTADYESEEDRRMVHEGYSDWDPNTGSGDYRNSAEYANY